MKRPPAKEPPPMPDWRVTNPGYRESEPRMVRIDGRECVEIDGGKLYDMAHAHERVGTKP